MAEHEEDRPLRLFEGYGIEIEYMIVDRDTLGVRPLADKVLAGVAGEIQAEVECGALAWSNELVMHVIELKTNGPAARLEGLAGSFQHDVRRIDALLEPHGARLMPTGMHPWMDPETEARLWPHEYGKVYQAFDRIFGCKGHGWSNLQSMHVNLPFADDEEFGRLHAAIRLLLPILPAISASSPAVDGAPTGSHDNRMRFYRTNARAVPSVSGLVVPEPVYTRADYEGRLLGGIYRDLEPHDPEGVLRHEWVNARGAIARFDRFAIEIRVLDTQECPRADLAVAAAVVGVLRAVVAGRWCEPERTAAWSPEPLAEILWAVVDGSDVAAVRNREYLRCLGVEADECTAGELWRHLVDEVLPVGSPGAEEWRPVLEVILEQGSLARRIVAALGEAPDRERLTAVYRALCDCLGGGRTFSDATV